MPLSASPIGENTRPREVISFTCAQPWFPGMTRRRAIWLSRRGQFPPWTRFSTRGDIWFNAAELRAFAETRWAALGLPLPQEPIEAPCPDDFLETLKRNPGNTSADDEDDKPNV